MAASKRRARVLVDAMVLRRVVRVSGVVGEAMIAEEMLGRYEEIYDSI